MEINQHREESFYKIEDLKREVKAPVIKYNGSAKEAKSNQEFPFEILDIDPNVAAVRTKLFNEPYMSYVKVGPKGYLFPQEYKQGASNIYKLPLRSTDIVVATYPRSGTTWTQELVWMVANDFDYEKSNATPLVERYTFLEYFSFVAPFENQLLEQNLGCDRKIKLLKDLARPEFKTLASAPSPRFIKTHLPMSILPPSMLDSAKVVYVARDPRDVAVSYYHFLKGTQAHLFSGDFKTFWEYFTSDLIIYSPFFPHLKEAWQFRHHPNMLFIFYEEILKDMPAVIRRVAKFLNKQATEAQISELCEHLHIDNFKTKETLDFKTWRDIGLPLPTKESFIRKGKSGSWRDYFDDEMAQQAEKWIEKNLEDTDFKFPFIET